MSSFTAIKSREVRESINMTQTEAAKYMHMDERTLRRIENNEKAVTADEIIQFSRIYRVDVRELLLESNAEQSEEQILFNRYISLGISWISNSLCIRRLRLDRERFLM